MTTPRRAVLFGLVAGWLLLPDPPVHTMWHTDDKILVVGLGTPLLAFVFDARSFLRLRPHWCDLPMVMWCISPLFSSLSNELGLKDGISESLGQTTMWGTGYVLGRAYFADPQGLRELALAIFIGALVYVPLCAYEMRMSPQLNNMVWGFQQKNWGTAWRYDGWRPKVFMDSGLMVGLWMSMASLLGVAIWRSRVTRTLFRIPMSLLSLGMILTTVMVKATGALGLLLMGLATIFVARLTKSRFPMWGLFALPLVYIILRTTTTFSGDALVDFAKRFSEERAQSLEFRLDNEDILMAKAFEQPLFGWGGWGRSRVLNDWGKDVSTTDGRWIIGLGKNGLFGMWSLVAANLVPFVMFLKSFRVRDYLEGEMMIVAALAVFLPLRMLDNIMNGQEIPAYWSICGGIAGFCLAYAGKIVPTGPGVQPLADPVRPVRYPTTTRRLSPGHPPARP